MKLVNYRCKTCEKGFMEEFYKNDETIPDEVELQEDSEDKCKECGGRVFEKWNFKKNDQVWHADL